MLFILAIDPLHRLLRAATEQGILAPLSNHCVNTRVSLYADDAILFANPSRREIDNLMAILIFFGDAMGLEINPEKSSVAAIRCEGIDLQDVLQGFRGRIVGFPMTYLGLPITLSRLCLVHLQFILDWIRARLAGWKVHLLSMAGRRVLVQCVLTAMPTYAFTVLQAPIKFFKDVDRARKRFLWAGDQELTIGHCKVNWTQVCSPVQNGGLGILNLLKCSHALRLQWMWLAWQQPSRSWVGSPAPCDAADHALFNGATKVTIGDGTTTSFWNSRWADVGVVRQMFPALYLHSRRKNRTVDAALTNHKLDQGSQPRRHRCDRKGFSVPLAHACRPSRDALAGGQ